MLDMYVFDFSIFSAQFQGLIAGVSISFLLLTIMFIGAQLNHIAKDPTLPLKTDECPNNDLIKLHLLVELIHYT